MPRRSERPTHPGVASLLKKAKLAHLQALAERVGLPKMTVYRILGNFNSHTSLLVYLKLANGLGCSVDHIASIYLDHTNSEELLRSLMKESNIKNGAQLAEKCLIHPSHGLQLIKNQRQHMQLGNYRAIAKGLYISLEHLSSVLIPKEALNDTTYGVLQDSLRPVTILELANRINNLEKRTRFAA